MHFFSPWLKWDQHKKRLNSQMEDAKGEKPDTEFHIFLPKNTTLFCLPLFSWRQSLLVIISCYYLWMYHVQFMYWSDSSTLLVLNVLPFQSENKEGAKGGNWNSGSWCIYGWVVGGKYFLLPESFLKLFYHLTDFPLYICFRFI